MSDKTERVVLARTRLPDCPYIVGTIQTRAFTMPGSTDDLVSLRCIEDFDASRNVRFTDVVSWCYLDELPGGLLK